MQNDGVVVKVAHWINSCKIDFKSATQPQLIYALLGRKRHQISTTNNSKMETQNGKLRLGLYCLWRIASMRKWCWEEQEGGEWVDHCGFLGRECDWSVIRATSLRARSLSRTLRSPVREGGISRWDQKINSGERWAMEHFVRRFWWLWLLFRVKCEGPEGFWVWSDWNCNCFSLLLCLE